MSSAALKIVRYPDLERWDVKYFLAALDCKYPLVPLAELVEEHNEKVKPNKEPDNTFKILGVNNTGGIFHAYDSPGRKIKQPYKKVNAGDFAYNPYRINVGSIGIVPPEHDGAYISPAYVVFRVNSEKLLPELLLFILKGEFFNESLRAATAGSVRMNLTYDLLRTLKVPLPPTKVQENILNQYKAFHQDLEKIRAKIVRQCRASTNVLYDQIGVPLPRAAKREDNCMIVRWSATSRWSFDYLQRIRSGLAGFNDSKYPLVSIEDILVDSSNGYCIKPSPSDAGTRTLKLNAITSNGALDLQQTKPVSIPRSIAERFGLEKGDLLVCRSVGSFDMIAKTALVDVSEEGLIFPDIMIRVRLDQQSILPEYALALFNSSTGRAHFQANARTAVGMWKIGAKDIKEFRIPLPSIPEQQAIVHALSNAERIVQVLQANEQNLEQSCCYETTRLILGLSKASKSTIPFEGH